MRIIDVIRRKGDEVVTIQPGETVARLIDMLDEHRIGALVVSTDGKQVAGIVSERDVVRHLHRDGPSILDATVEQIMTADVETCGPDAGVEDLMRTMTEHRVRHVPVLIDGELRGIVSIGDVVKQRIDELATERDQLMDYIHR